MKETFEELPKKLPYYELPLGSEWDAQHLAEEYNALPETDPKKEILYKEWESAADFAEYWD